MFRFVILFALLNVAFGEIQLSGFNGRIVNGVDTTISEHPYQVSLQSVKGGHFCGGSIINKNTIVTAAHCLLSHSASQMRVRLGSTNHTSGGKMVKVLKIVAHPYYNKEKSINDIGVVKLAEDVAESSAIRYIKLAKNSPATGTAAVVTGWGSKCYFWCMTLSTTLQKVEVSIVSKDLCASRQYNYGSASILDSMICAYEVEKDACQGDSGGPLVANSQLVGVVSWGKSCAKSGYPGVYADVAALNSWVLQNSS
ncbi:trypsin [Eurosta solidaginis]|uniref:trypsin n=1 Tax=Eurosta solidaginis TaxID=178769 RepID=UPI0035312F2F